MQGALLNRLMVAVLALGLGGVWYMRTPAAPPAAEDVAGEEEEPAEEQGEEPAGEEEAAEPDGAAEEPEPEGAVERPAPAAEPAGTRGEETTVAERSPPAAKPEPAAAEKPARQGWSFPGLPKLGFFGGGTRPEPQPKPKADPRDRIMAAKAARERKAMEQRMQRRYQNYVAQQEMDRAFNAALEVLNYEDFLRQQEDWQRFNGFMQPRTITLPPGAVRTR